MKNIFEQDPRTEEVTVDELEVGDHCLLVSDEMGGHFALWNELDWSITHCVKVEPNSPLIEGDHYLRQNHPSSGTTLGLEQEDAESIHVIKLEKFSVSKQSFIDKVKELLGGFVETILEQEID